MYNQASISDYYRAVAKAIESDILQSDKNFILETDTDKLVSHFVNPKYDLQQIEFDLDKKETMLPRKEMRRIPANQRDVFYRYDGDTNFEYEMIDIVLPIKENRNISETIKLNPSTRTFGWSPEDVKWYPNHISFTFDIKGYGFKHDDDQIANGVTNTKKNIQNWIGWINADIAKESAALRNALVPQIEARKLKLKEDEGRMSSLSEKMGMSLDN